MARTPRRFSPGSQGRDRPIKTEQACESGRVNVVYIHGVGNKPPASVLKCEWDRALFGAEVGDRSRMAYWVNRAYYPQPLEESFRGGEPLGLEAAESVALGMHGDQLDAAVETEIEAITDDARQAEILTAIAERIGSRASEFDVESRHPEALPAPRFVRRWMTRHLTRLFLRDVNDFLFHEDRRAVMESALSSRLSACNDSYIVIGHSQGSLIAYEVLRKLDPASVHIPLFVTIGTPLGIQEVQDQLRQWQGDELRCPECVEKWVNVADRLDPVAADPWISNDFTPDGFITDHVKWFLNPDSPRHPHSGTGYLQTDYVRSPVRVVGGPGLAQPISSFIVAADLVETMEDDIYETRLPVLIEFDTNADEPLEVIRENIERELEDLVGDRASDAEIEPLRHYVAAQLTRQEIEGLANRRENLRFHRIWKDAEKKALLHQSVHTIQSNPARQSYGAEGEAIHWAVLDTGIRGDHPHFEAHENVVEQWDCTVRGIPKRAKVKNDKNGHGTHVAAIIAGSFEEPLILEETDEEVLVSGIAPLTKIYDYKVLSDSGSGRDSWIIKALDHIAARNETSGRLVIQGVNLSLGGPFDRRVYGCGHSPLCQELRRLWRQGVVVVLAAGNEGHVFLEGQRGRIEANLDISINDPANLEEAIAVGSIHKSNPHTYGVSYFSSRGPTADGRIKPDVVAPGEKILSASHRFAKGDSENVYDYYVEMSGTSMAAPHVSGMLAAFMSLRREFIGFPDRVKQTLIASCTDLQRDRYIQGHGMPNLMRMLSST